MSNQKKGISKSNSKLSSAELFKKISRKKKLKSSELQELSMSNPDVLIECLKTKISSFNEGYLERLAIFEVHENEKIKTFGEEIAFLKKENLKFQNQKKVALQKLQNASLQSIIISTIALLKKSTIVFDSQIGILNSLLADLFRERKGERIKVIEESETCQKELIQELINIYSLHNDFLINLVYPYCYDKNMVLDLKDGRLKIEDIEKHFQWVKNGFKIQIEQEYYRNIVWTATGERLLKNKQDIAAIRFQNIISHQYLADYGINPADSYDMGFSVKDIHSVLYALKILVKEVNNAGLLGGSVSNWIKNIFQILSGKLSFEKIENILKKLWAETSNLKQFDFIRTPILKQGDNLFLLTDLFHALNLHVPILKKIYRKDFSKRIKGISANQEKLLCDLFLKAGLKAISGRNFHNHCANKEIDVAVADENDILIIEIKGTYIRGNLKNSHEHAFEKLKDAESQLNGIKSLLESEDSKDLNWLKDELGIPCSGEHKIHYLMVSTSFEWDDFELFDFPKVTLFTLIHILRNDRFYFDISSTEAFQNFYLKEEIHNIPLLLMKPEIKTILKELDDLIYYEKLSVQKFLGIIKSDLVWRHLNMPAAKKSIDSLKYYT